MTGPRKIEFDLGPAGAARLDMLVERTGIKAEYILADIVDDALARAIPSPHREPPVFCETQGANA